MLRITESSSWSVQKALDGFHSIGMKDFGGGIRAPGTSGSPSARKSISGVLHFLNPNTP